MSRGWNKSVQEEHTFNEKGLRFPADLSYVSTLTTGQLLRFDDCSHIDRVVTKVGRDLIDQVGWSLFF